LHLHQNRSKLIKTGRNRSKQIENDDMIYQKIKNEKENVFSVQQENLSASIYFVPILFFSLQKNITLSMLCFPTFEK